MPTNPQPNPTIIPPTDSDPLADGQSTEPPTPTSQTSITIHQSSSDSHHTDGTETDLNHLAPTQPLKPQQPQQSQQSQQSYAPPPPLTTQKTFIVPPPPSTSSSLNQTSSFDADPSHYTQSLRPKGDYTITRYALLTCLSLLIFGAVVTHQFAMFYFYNVHHDSEMCSITSMIYMIYIIMIISALTLFGYLCSIFYIMYLHASTQKQHPNEGRDEFFKRRHNFYESLPKIRFQTWYYCNLLIASCNTLCWFIAAGINFCVPNVQKFVFIISFFAPSIYFWLCFIVGSLCRKSMLKQDPLCCLCILRNPRSYDDLAQRRNRDADVERYYQRL